MVTGASLNFEAMCFAKQVDSYIWSPWSKSPSPICSIMISVVLEEIQEWFVELCYHMRLARTA